jgi:hypothetical protein
MAKFAKGSAAARLHMAALRAMRKGGRRTHRGKGIRSTFARAASNLRSAW